MLMSLTLFEEFVEQGNYKLDINITQDFLAHYLDYDRFQNQVNHYFIMCDENTPHDYMSYGHNFSAYVAYGFTISLFDIIEKELKECHQKLKLENKFIDGKKIPHKESTWITSTDYAASYSIKTDSRSAINEKKEWLKNFLSVMTPYYLDISHVEKWMEDDACYISYNHPDNPRQARFSFEDEMMNDYQKILLTAKLNAQLPEHENLTSEPSGFKI
jgi:hypothetical protein